MYKYVCLVLTLAQYIQGECPGGCDEPQVLYRDLDCKPIYDKPTDCCPKKYDCSHIEQSPKDKCLLQGKTYKVGDTVPDSEIYKNCFVACRCNEEKTFTCAVLDCPEWLGLRPNVTCHFKYELDKCCSVGQICPPFDEEIKCKVGDTTYLEGQRFSPPDEKCMSCVCQKGFKGEFVEPFCAKDTCSAEVRHTKDIKDNCAPVYLPHSECCPYQWLCASDDDKINPGPTGKQNSDLKCKFGKSLLDIGANFEKDGAKCECKIPPFVTCRKTSY